MDGQSGSVSSGSSFGLNSGFKAAVVQPRLPGTGQEQVGSSDLEPGLSLPSATCDPGTRGAGARRAVLEAAQGQAGPGSEDALSSCFQVLYLLDVVRNGIHTQNMRLTFTLALFVAKAALQILKPGTRGEGEAGSECGGRAGSATREGGRPGHPLGPRADRRAGGCEEAL